MVSGNSTVSARSHSIAWWLLVQALLTAGADVNAEDGSGDTPLHQACAGGFVEIVEVRSYDVFGDI
jgi:ankyrin repeat protein